MSAKNRAAPPTPDYRALLLFADLLAAGGICVGLLYTAAAATADFRSIGTPVALLVVAWLDTIFFWGQYTLYPQRPWLIQGYLLAQCLVLGTVIAAGLTVLFPSLHPLPTPFYLAATALMLPATLAIRLAALALLPREMTVERYLLLVDGEGTRTFWSSLRRVPLPRHAEIVGTVSVNGHSADPFFEGVPNLGHAEDLPEIVLEHGVRSLILTRDYPLSDTDVRAITQCAESGVRILSPFTAYEEISYRTPLYERRTPQEASLVTAERGKYATRLKRITDIVATLLLLPLGVVLIGLAALAILLTDGRPVFYAQERVGKDGRVFRLYKLRTMVRNAEEKTGPVWSRHGDPRITPVGRWLRATRLDELPQLFNVLRGDMSLVGPRPERPEFVQAFVSEIPYYEQRLLVRPGMTGWAQVQYHYDRTVEDVYEKLRYDLYYLRHLSFPLDLQILLATIGVVFSRRGAH